jgi:hypothetical protein
MNPKQHGGMHDQHSCFPATLSPMCSRYVVGVPRCKRAHLEQDAPGGLAAGHRLVRQAHDPRLDVTGRDGDQREHVAPDALLAPAGDAEVRASVLRCVAGVQERVMRPRRAGEVPVVVEVVVQQRAADEHTRVDAHPRGSQRRSKVEARPRHGERMVEDARRSVLDVALLAAHAVGGQDVCGVARDYRVGFGVVHGWARRA